MKFRLFGPYVNNTNPEDAVSIQTAKLFYNNFSRFKDNCEKNAGEDMALIDYLASYEVGVVTKILRNSEKTMKEFVKILDSEGLSDDPLANIYLEKLRLSNQKERSICYIGNADSMRVIEIDA
jgi:intergrase/recombinase